MKEKLEAGLRLASLLAFLYVAAYFALARPGATLVVSGKWTAWPRYIGLPDCAEVYFGPLNDWDRRVLRPSFWAGTIPPDQWRQQQLLAAEWALKVAQAAMVKK